MIMSSITNLKPKNISMKNTDGKNTRTNITKMFLPGFFEGYYLPHKFGFDTRKNVASNEILAGTLSREEASGRLTQPPYDTDQMLQDKEYIAKKLGITTEEFDAIIEAPKRTPTDYKNSMWLIKLGITISKILGLENRNLKV